MLKCPIHELPSNIVINNFYARLILHDKDLLDASCSRSFTRMKEKLNGIFLTVYLRSSKLRGIEALRLIEVLSRVWVNLSEN
jgi:hypothetical protein